jgi:CheY-like chemotaxis protein
MKQVSALIIDDSSADCYLLSRQLKETGLVEHIFERNDGQAALDFLIDYETNSNLYPKGFPPVLVFLDINMPILDGYGFLKEFDKLRKTSKYDSCIFMMFTSSGQQVDKDEALEYEFVKDYLLKGQFSTEELKERITKYLDID